VRILVKSTRYRPVAESRVNAPCSSKYESWAALARPCASVAPKRIERKMLARKVT